MQNSLPAFCGNVVVMPLYFAMIGHGSAVLLRGKGGEVVKRKKLPRQSDCQVRHRSGVIAFYLNKQVGNSD